LFHKIQVFEVNILQLTETFPIGIWLTDFITSEINPTNMYLSIAEIKNARLAGIFRVSQK